MASVGCDCVSKLVAVFDVEKSGSTATFRRDPSPAWVIAKTPQRAVIIVPMIEIPASEVLQSLPESINDITKSWSEGSRDHLALVEASGSWTYGQLNDAIDRASAWLVESGVRPGDRVMIVCENCRALVAIFLALIRIDAWPVLANARLSAREVDDIRDHCGARRVIYTTRVSPHATQHAKRHGAVIGEVAGIDTIGFGSLNENVEPEPIEKDYRQSHRRCDLHFRNHRASQRRSADPPEPAVHRGCFGKDPRADSE